MRAVVSALLAATATLLFLPRRVPLVSESSQETPHETGTITVMRVRGAAAVAGVALWLLLGGGAVGAVVGAGAAVVAVRVLSSMTGSKRLDPAQLERQAAEASELMAACLASGATLQRTTLEVARALEEPIAELLHEAAAMMAMGASVEVAWQQLAAHDATAPIARALVRSATTGAPSAEALVHVATDLRNRRHAAAQTRVRAVGVAAVGPLGLCFLPAFLLLGVVPVVAVLIGERSTY